MAAPDEVNESIKLHFVKTCMNTFAKTPYTWQTNVGSFIYGCHLLNSPLKLLLVRPTGGGKTLVFTSVAACIKASVAACSIKGITLCITPLLSLGADQVQKITWKTSETDKSIIGFHLNELTDAQLLELQNYLSTLPPPTTKTIVLFSSLVQRSIVSDKIRFLVFNKIHLAVHYGKTFRKEFGQLKVKLFDQIHLPIPMLFMTTTCTESIALSFENLIGIKFDSKHWPAPIGMMHRSVLFRNLLARRVI
jgi:superfamily II DNA helicase RecQ